MDDVLMREYEALESVEKRANRDVERAPQGKLRLSRSHGCLQYYCRIGNSTKYLAVAQRDCARKLAQKEYAEAVLKEIRFRRSVLAKIERWQDHLSDCGGSASSDVADDGGISLPCDALVLLEEGSRRFAFSPRPDLSYIRRIFERLPEERKALVEPYVCSDEVWIARWLAEKPAEGKPSQAPCIFGTGCGISVRSKSEMIIADRLYRAGVPFRYEQPVQVGDITVYPDFLVLNKRTQQEMIWEHFGLMEDGEYAARALKKLAFYSSAGLVPGAGLAVTFESQTRPLDIAAVDCIVASLA